MKAKLTLFAVVALFVPAMIPGLTLSNGLDDARWLDAKADADSGMRFDRSDFYTLNEAVQTIATALPSDVPSEVHCLAQAVYFEARSEPIEGQLAVAQVVLNRVHSRAYPDTICSVVFQNERWRNRCQFSFACDGLSDNPYNQGAWQTANSVATLALSGIWEDVTDTATHYHADYVDPYWRNAMHQTAQHGRHVFYRVTED